MTAKKAGFVTIVGLPNVGKSTMMNRLIGQKIAITSYKPQTTRTRIRTMYNDARGQIVFVDTPGVQWSKSGLGEYMLRASTGALKDVDLVLYLTEARRSAAEEEAMFALLKKAKAPVFLVVNKIDTMKEEDLLPLLQTLSERFSFAEVYPISAREGIGMEALVEGIFRALPEGEPFYEEDQITTETERDIAAEIIREKALRLLQEEVPHGIAVLIERMRERQKRDGTPITDIDAVLICEKESHKGIIIGRQGEMLRRIGTDARRDIENMLQQQVNLKLYVKVRAEWRDSSAQLKSFGYDAKAF